MSAVFFQIKPTKRSNPEARTTLDALHTNHIQTLKEKKKTVVDIHNDIGKLETQISSSTDYIKIARMEKEVVSLKEKAGAIEKNSHIYDYFLETGDVLFEYYDIQDKIASGAGAGQISTPIPLIDDLDISPRDKSTEPASAPAPMSGSILSFLETAATKTASTKFARDELLDKYLQKISPEQARCYNAAIDDKTHQCPDCKGEMVMCPNESQLSCSKCGAVSTILIDSDKPSYKDPPREVSYYAYKRINHFNECLAQFQAKESTEIPQEVFDQIAAQLKKQRFLNMATVKAAKIREILKKLDLSQYYEHIPYIINRLNGKKVLTMDRETEEKLRHIFKEIQPAFERHKPADRHNFISYHYYLYKICQLLDLDEFLPCFNLLKNRDKLYDQDKIWKNICADMKWQFIKTT